MKGHTKIELTNVKTGEVQVYEDDNIVTNWLRDAHQIQLPTSVDSYKHTKDLTLTGYSITETDNVRTPIRDFGGLIMFQEQLDADPDNYYPRGKVTMVAHASDEPYTGTDLTRGSFNDNLSSYTLWDGRSATLVWDFGLEQGNGTIGTVCLCNHVDGKIGYGSRYLGENSNEGRAPFYHHAGSGGMGAFFEVRYHVPLTETRSNSYYSGFFPVYISTEENKIIFMMNCLYDDNLVFAVQDIDASSVLPFDYIYRRDNTIYHYQYANRTQFYEIPVNVRHYASSTSYTKHNTNYCFTPFNYLMIMSGLDFQGNFWFSKNANTLTGSTSTTSSRQLLWSSGSAQTFVKVNLKTMETTEYSVYNTTGSAIHINCSCDHHAHLCNICVYNDYLYVRGDDAKLYAINLTNNSDVHVVMRDDGSDLPIYVYKDSSYEGTSTAYPYNYSYRRGWAVDVLGDKIIFNTIGGLVYNPSSNSTAFNDGNMWILDTSTFTCKPLCAVQRPLCNPSPSTGSASSVPNNRNSTYYNLFCHTDSLVRFCFRVFYYSGTSSYNGVSTYTTWNDTDKYIDSEFSLGSYGYPPLGLLTINTLSEPVTKTADMTMRITYTLTA